MASITGLVFLIIFLGAPERGIIAVALRRSRQRWDFAQSMLTIHLLQHEGKPEAERESRSDHLVEHLRWLPDHAEKVIRYAERKGMIRRQSGQLLLTDAGRTLARQAMVH